MATKKEILTAYRQDIATVLGAWRDERNCEETDAWKKITAALDKADDLWSIDEPHVQGYRMDLAMTDENVVQQLEDEREAKLEDSGDPGEHDEDEDEDEIDLALIPDAVKVRIARGLVRDMLESGECDADIDPLFRMIPLGGEGAPPFLVFEVTGYSFSGVETRWIGVFEDQDDLQEYAMERSVIFSKAQLDAMSDDELLDHCPSEEL